MLNELRRFENIGEKEDIIYFLQVVIGHQRLSKEDITAKCLHATGNYSLNIDALLAFCSFCGILQVEEKIQITESILRSIDDCVTLQNYLLEKTLSGLFANQIFKEDFFFYDIDRNMFAFRNERLSLHWASIRNFLISLGFFNTERTELGTRFFIDPKYEKTVSKYCKPKKKIMSVEKLRRELERQCEAGEQAELFVLDFEKRRLINVELIKKIKIISDIDVCAGYDIISFQSDESTEHDRFIEVKAVTADFGFYWSDNELETARLKGSKYYLYLVELSKISDTYNPTIICDPAKTLLHSNEWIVEPQTYRIRCIDVDSAKSRLTL